MTIPDEFHEEPELTACLEALLFAAPAPVFVNQLAMVLEMETSEVREGLKQLADLYQHRGGLSLQWHGDRVQLTTNPVMGELVEKFLGLETTTRLSRAALEALAIISYQQPVTRPQMDAIRGVSSDGVIKSLLSKGLIQEEGRAETPGRPIKYGTTTDFLQYFGLSSLSELPAIESLVDTVNDPGNQKILKE
jgi:segregation and condensation protein B